ncbi:S41 family peptidase [Massilia arenosa]|uniref:S41 family peptidase n=1 Tax=Zemynaea arenosa TaxID=2561931 RepID=A0A4Y9SF67_9BURK|nr:S41 family peptidase [Massilia arenosa]TFW22145.1 S41 family peptidase [Massilia arenosa]
MKFKSLGLVGVGMVAGVAISLQFSAFAQRTGSPLPLDELRQLADVYGIIKTDYVEPVQDKKLLEDAISGMVSSLDPHSVYLDKEAYRELKENVAGKFVGLGIEVAAEDGYVKIVSPIEDSPAYRAGVKAGDLITRIDSTPIKGMSLDDAIKRMRGEPGTKVTLTIARKGEDKPWVTTLAREEIHVQSVKAKFVEPGYAWVRITQFQEQTVEDMAKKVQDLYAQNPAIKGLVLDLRNDPGGLLPGAIGVSAAFIPKDEPVVSTRGQLADQNQVFYARKEFYVGRSGGDPLAKIPAQLKTVPMVVLVNTGSASASEIVAGALQDYKRAIIMGSQTFGKGSVQTLRPLGPDTAVKLTTARYYTPKNRSIQARGIVPDLMVDETPDGDGLNALRVREVDLDKHLSNVVTPETAKAKRDELEESQLAKAVERARKPIEFGSKDDFQLAQALNHFKGLPVQLSKAEPRPAQPEPDPKAKPDTKPAEIKAPAKK